MDCAKGSPDSCISTAASMCSRTTKRVSRALTVMNGRGGAAVVEPRPAQAQAASRQPMARAARLTELQ